jgi:hypothetical protein
MKASIGSVAENSSKEVYVFRGNIMVHRTVAGNCIPLGKGGGIDRSRVDCSGSALCSSR